MNSVVWEFCFIQYLYEVNYFLIFSNRLIIAMCIQYFSSLFYQWTTMQAHRVSFRNPVILFNSSTYYLHHQFVDFVLKHYINASSRLVASTPRFINFIKYSINCTETSGHYVNRFTTADDNRICLSILYTCANLLSVLIWDFLQSLFLSKEQISYHSIRRTR
jgi:hypothetical protein